MVGLCRGVEMSWRPFVAIGPMLLIIITPHSVF